MLCKDLNDELSPKGRVEIFVSKGAPTLLVGKPVLWNGHSFVYDDCRIVFSKNQLISSETVMNIIVNKGKDKIITALTLGYTNPIARVCIGDRGAIPSDPTTPKVPLKTFTSLYNEVYRADADTQTANVGTDDIHEVKFIKTFNAVDIPIAAFSNQSKPVVNEVGLITCDPSSTPLPRTPVIALINVPADEQLFSMRAFKSVPFEAANEIAVTIRYTIFIQ